jgi:DNA-binding LacI/PurR family transcriptional regulator
VKGGKVLEDTYSTKFLKGVLNYLSQKGLKLIVDIHESSDIVEYYNSIIQSKIIDGFILLDLRKNDERIKFLKKEKFPFVVIGRNDENDFIYVDSDNVSGAYMAIKHLKEIKCKKILYISGNEGIPVSEQRLRGVESASNDLNVSVDVVYGDFDEEKTVEILKSILKKGFDYDGIFCASDTMAYAAIKFLKRFGIEVPIIGYDNIPLSEVVGLTTVDQNIIKIGYSAAQALDKLVNGEDVVSLIVPSKLVKRQSTLNFS